MFFTNVSVQKYDVFVEIKLNGWTFVMLDSFLSLLLNKHKYTDSQTDAHSCTLIT